MAELKREGDDVVLHLSTTEKLEGAHGDLRAPVSSIVTAEVLDNAHAAADIIGFRVGTRLPGVIEVASVHGLKKTIFAAVHHNTPRGVRISFQGADQDEWVVGCNDPEGELRALDLPTT